MDKIEALLSVYELILGFLIIAIFGIASLIYKNYSDSKKIVVIEVIAFLILTAFVVAVFFKIHNLILGL